jgi:cell wall-associated NlpC family hydrolase
MLIGVGGKNDEQSLALQTRGKRDIPNAVARKRSPEEMRAARSMWLYERPQIEVRSLDSTYNCMGMVFGARRTSIDIGSLSMILTDDGYRRVAMNQAKVGDVVVSVRGDSPTHVGILAKIDRSFEHPTYTVLSQWGHDGEYVHRHDHVPIQYGSLSEVWTDRQMP